ncbi:MAG TPA: hypothetical protein VFC07_08430 [Verrucomicrobiae bacterium]|nr:hypothetical protein [Verrucomicrobiae bacterium]
MSLLNHKSDTAIEDKEKLEQDFLAFLCELGYPEDSIFRGPSFRLKESGQGRLNLYNWFGKTVSGTENEPLPCYADLAILDLDSRQYACLIEFRLQLDEEIESKLAGLFQAIFDCTQTKPPVFLVVPGANAGFRIHQLRENGNWQELPQRQFPHYPTLTAGLAAESALAQEVKQARDLDRFTITCYLLAGAVGLLTVVNIAGLSALTAIQLLLLILAALLVVAPHAVGFRLAAPKGRSKPSKIK